MKLNDDLYDFLLPLSYYFNLQGKIISRFWEPGCKYKQPYREIWLFVNLKMSIIKYYFVLTNLEHSLHIPFITKLILSNKNLSGNWIGGMAILSRQKVFLHRLQLKCTCKSPTVHIQLSLQIEYFIAPEPSSIV